MLFLCLPLNASSDRASRFLLISPSAEQSSIMNNVRWPFNVFLNNLTNSFNFPSTSHTIKTFLSSRIHFLERYVLLSKIVGHKITMNSKWFLYTVSSSRSKNSVLPQCKGILGGSYINRLHSKTGHLRFDLSVLKYIQIARQFARRSSFFSYL